MVDAASIIHLIMLIPTRWTSCENPILLLFVSRSAPAKHLKYVNNLFLLNIAANTDTTHATKTPHTAQ